MPSIADLSFRLLDPRGRCDRRGLLILAIGMLCGEAVIGAALLGAGLELEGPVVIGLKAICVYIAFTAASKRLHDLGRSAWWVLAAFVAIVVWSAALAVSCVLLLDDLAALTPDSAAGFAVISATTVPTLAILLWLHCAKGNPGPNRYGPVTEASGFSARPRRASVIVTEPTMLAT